MNRGVATFFACAAMAVSAVGCGDDDPDAAAPAARATSTDSVAPNNDTPGRPDTPADHLETKAWRVEITDSGYRPRDLTIEIADTVIWKNVGRQPHTVDAIAQAGLTFVSSPIAPGAAFEKGLLTRERTIDYYCQLHPRMRGRLVVE